MDDTKPVSKTNHPSRRRSDVAPDEERRYVETLERRLAIVETKLDANTAITQQSVEMWKNMEAGIKVLGALGAFAKWLTPIIILGATVWALITGKPLPGKGN